MRKKITNVVEMKVFIDCECAMTSDSLNSFLKEFLSDENDADIIICDYEKERDKLAFFIGKDIKEPFTKERLISALNEFLEYSKNSRNLEFQNKLDTILSRFRTDLLELFEKNER